MNTNIWHDQLHNRYCIDGLLEAVSPLRISSGVASKETDAPFIRDSEKKPYIPGSSLRGALRSAVERILGGIDESITGLKCCTLFSENDCAKKHRDDMKRILAITKEKQRNKELEEVIQHKICDLCRLFGNTMFASRIFFKDGYAANAEKNCMIRDGVGIDRDTGATVTGAKYDYEVIDATDDLTFNFSLTVENAVVKDKKIVGLMLRLLTEGIFIGGKRAGGMGCIKLIPDSIRIDSFESPEQAWERLKEGKAVLAANDVKWEEVFQC